MNRSRMRDLKNSIYPARAGKELGEQSGRNSFRGALVMGGDMRDLK
ncbi:MAG: hypothetical protein K2P87_16085 [Lachnospiraceae bacterium]|nr:hypothetical protein [Lachnospiraceae bacterium]